MATKPLFREQLHRHRQAPIADTATAKIDGVLRGLPAPAELARWHLDVVRIEIDELGQRENSTSQRVSGSGDTVEAEGEAPPIPAADYSVSMAIAAATANPVRAHLGLNCQEPLQELGFVYGRATRLTCTLLEAVADELAHMAEREHFTGGVVGNLEIELPLYGHNELYRIKAHVPRSLASAERRHSTAGGQLKSARQRALLLHLEGAELR